MNEELKEKTFVKGCENAPSELSEKTYNPLHSSDEELFTKDFLLG